MYQQPKTQYVAEVKFNDSTGNPVTIGINFGDKIPPISKKEAKVFFRALINSDTFIKEQEYNKIS